MDDRRFDELTRALARGGSRRQVLKAFAGAAGMGLGLFGRSSRSSALAQSDALQGQANQDAGYRALRQYLQKAGFQPQGAAEAADVSEDGAWIASALGRDYANRQSGVVATLVYVAHATGTAALAVLASGGTPYTILATGADGSVFETLVPEPTQASTINAQAHSLATRMQQLPSGMQMFPVRPAEQSLAAAALPEGVCAACEPVCEYAVGKLAEVACKFGPRLQDKIKAVAKLAARCAAGGTVAAICVAVYYGLCKLGGLEAILNLGCGSACGALSCGEPPPPECGVCQVLQNGVCAPVTCPACQTCDPGTGACEGECPDEDPPPDEEPPPDGSCSVDSDCLGLGSLDESLVCCGGQCQQCCSDGDCAAELPPNNICCGGVCSECCSNAQCGDGATCDLNTGTCVPCDPNTDFQTDRNNCGGCGIICSEGQQCIEGICADCGYLNANGGACYVTETTSVCCADPMAICHNNYTPRGPQCCRPVGLACASHADCCESSFSRGCLPSGVCG